MQPDFLFKMDFRDHTKAAQTDFEAHYIENDHIQLHTHSLSERLDPLLVLPAEFHPLAVKMVSDTIFLTSDLFTLPNE